MGETTEAEASATVRPVLNPAQIRELRALVRDALRRRAAEGLHRRARRPPRATRRATGSPSWRDFIAYGASPRATLAFSAAARAHAFLRGRGYVVPEDVKEIALDVLRHRVLLTYEAEAENVTSDQVVARILERVEVP